MDRDIAKDNRTDQILAGQSRILKKVIDDVDMYEVLADILQLMENLEPGDEIFNPFS